MNFSDDELERYARHLVLPQFGGRGQASLARARVAVVGAGGLGQQMDNSMKMFNGAEVATLLLVFVALVALTDRLSALLRRVLG